jgi:hypothetical protein
VILVRLRTRAGLYLSGLLVFCGLSLAAQATQPVTRSEMESFVYSTLAVAALATLTGGAGILAWILARDRDLQREHLSQIITAISELASGLNGAIKALEAHNDDEYAHGPAQKRGHEPILQRLDAVDALGRAISDLVAKESRLYDEVGRLREQIEALAGGRDPMKSRMRRTDTDDHRGERGKG